MNKKLNALIGKKFNPKTYHCWHFIEECMSVPKLDDVHVDSAKDDVEKYVDMFNEIPEPVDNCLVLIGKSHIGVWYKGGIYHNDVNGVRYETLRVLKMRYPSFKYYEVEK